MPFGDAVVSTPDTVLGCETCEELFTGNRYILARLGGGASILPVCLSVVICLLLQPTYCHGAGWCGGVHQW